MTSSDSSTVYRSSGGGKSGIVSVAGVVALFAIAVSLFLVGSEMKYGNCVAAQTAKYPAIGVSAFNTKSTGPIKVAYDAERRKAVESC